MFSVQMLVSIVLASLLFSSQGHGACPDGWEHFNDSCYNFVNRERSWAAAAADCFRQGSRLVKVDSMEENDFIRNYLISNGRYFYGYDLWMGGKADGRGGWDWVDGSILLPTHFQDWNGGHAPSASEASMCLELESDYSYHWNQDFCDELSYSICERPFQPMTPPTPARRTTTPTGDMVG